jgi:hypothetical protein
VRVLAISPRGKLDAADQRGSDRQSGCTCPHPHESASDRGWSSYLFDLRPQVDADMPGSIPETLTLHISEWTAGLPLDAWFAGWNGLVDDAGIADSTIWRDDDAQPSG